MTDGPETANRSARWRPGAWPAWVLPVLIAVTFFATGAAWAVSSPVGSSPDDGFHLGSVYCAWDPQPQNCKLRDDTTYRGKRAAYVRHDLAASCYAYKPEVSAGCTKKSGSYPVLRDINGGSYPPIFYDVMRVFAGDDIGRSILLMRLFNVALAAGLIAAAFALGPPVVRRSLVLGWFATTVPLTIFFVASTNPSSWAIIGLGTYWALLWGYLQAERRSVAVLSGLLALLSACVALARADGAAFIVVVTFAVLVLTTPSWRRLLSIRLLVPMLTVAMSTLVFLTSRQSNVVIGSRGGGTSVIPADRQGLGLFANNVINFPSLVGGALGQDWGLGWLDTRMPVGVSLLTFSVAFSIVLLSTRYWLRKVVAVAAVAFLLLALPLYVLQRGHYIVSENVQPRYLLPLLIVGIAFATLVHREDGVLREPIRGGQLTVLVVALALANALALWTNMRRYITGVDVGGLNLDAPREWWWSTSVPPMAAWAGGAVAGAAMFVVLALASRTATEIGALTAADDRAEETAEPVAIDDALPPPTGLGSPAGGPASPPPAVRPSPGGRGENAPA